MDWSAASGSNGCSSSCRGWGSALIDCGSNCELSGEDRKGFPLCLDYKTLD